jgi:hypothetical protein
MAFVTTHRCRSRHMHAVLKCQIKICFKTKTRQDLGHGTWPGHSVPFYQRSRQEIASDPTRRLMCGLAWRRIQQSDTVSRGPVREPWVP